MSDIRTSTVSDEGFASSSQVGEFELGIDATGETGPDPNAVLVADYAACFLPAFRVGAQQRDHDDLGKVQIDADADLDDDDDLEAIRFDIHVEADLDGGTLAEIVERAEDICHVHSALRPELRAEIATHGDAF
ncbi:OsmC family protein [Halobellus ruber]|uniref:OsmC family protein n=1 Tax=Halobellus ruber TaxID=2761102 RepID=A0A7J9SEI0_9EURY|nr:OsmC family protein [Halobellus ruber]MBB6645355.1 OsmC family protein [Halobellus ruber]